MSAASLNGYRVTPYQNSYTDSLAQQEEAKPLRRAVKAPETPTSSIPNEVDQRLKACVDELLEIRRIGDDWDGDGAIAPLPELVDSAIDFVNQRVFSVPPSRVVPVNDGRVTLEWDINGTFLSLRVESPYGGRLMTVKPNGQTEFSSQKWCRKQNSGD